MSSFLLIYYHYRNSDFSFMLFFHLTFFIQVVHIDITEVMHRFKILIPLFRDGILNFVFLSLSFFFFDHFYFVIRYNILCDSYIVIFSVLCDSKHVI